MRSVIIKVGWESIAMRPNVSCGVGRSDMGKSAAGRLARMSEGTRVGEIQRKFAAKFFAAYFAAIRPPVNFH
jgi:hypothetical protein